MPYIHKERRAALDVIIEGLVKRLRDIGQVKGDVNYAITRIVLETLNDDNYATLSDCVSVLRDSADEIQRRLLAPYEETSIRKNGDMPCFNKPYTETGEMTANVLPPGAYPPVTEAFTDEQYAEIERQRNVSK
jgi:hypothetical protein